MSFTSEVKEEALRNELSDDGKKAQLSGIIQLLASLSISKGGLNLILNSTNAMIIRRVKTDIQTIYSVDSEISMVKQQKLDKKNNYTLTIKEKVKEILNDLDLWTDKGLQEHPRLMFLSNEEMIRCYLTGCFLATGSVNSPSSTSYHLEIKANSESHGMFLIKLLEKFNITSHITTRRNNHIVYIKASESISDFLRIMGTFQAVMDFEDVRIQRDFVNSLHRLDNITIANEQKSQEVALKQIEAVNYLKERDLLKYLSAKDREIAILRINNPFASLNELSELYQEDTGTSLSKSGIRHRFDNVYALVQKYKEKENQEGD